MDCVRTAVRLGAENVSCVYRRTEAEMLGRGEERKNAREEGVNFEMLTLPTRIIGDENGPRGLGASASEWNWASRTNRAGGARSR